MFHGDMAYHDYEGISDDAAEASVLARDSRQESNDPAEPRPDNGWEVRREAFWRMYMLEMAFALRSIVPSRRVANTSCRSPRSVESAKAYEQDFFPGLRMAGIPSPFDRVEPDYAR